MTLASAREATRPLDVIPIYERAVAAQIDAKKSSGYRAAVDLLGRVRALAAKAGEPERFKDLLVRLKSEQPVSATSSPSSTRSAGAEQQR
jgi:hypothetical protein